MRQNNATHAGGGCFIKYADGIIKDSIFGNNTADYGSGEGGHIRIDDDVSLCACVFRWGACVYVYSSLFLRLCV